MAGPAAERTYEQGLFDAKWIEVNDKLDRLLLSVEGNGKPGLKDNVRDLVTRVEALEKAAQERAEDLKSLLRPLILDAVKWGIITVVVLAATHFLK